MPCVCLRERAASFWTSWLWACSWFRTEDASSDMVSLFLLSFFWFFWVFGLTKWRFGCILYDVGLQKGRCSPQNCRSDESFRWYTGYAGPKKIWKIFGIRFDKAQKCAIVNITVWFGGAGWDGEWSLKSPWDRGSVVSVVGKCSSQRGSGFFPEFFEKSIDKQKIDAILNSAVRFLRYGLRAVPRAAEAGCIWYSAAIPIQGTDVRTPGTVCILYAHCGR